MLTEPFELPLSGLRADLTALGAAGDVAAWLLTGMGVAVDVAPRSGRSGAGRPGASPPGAGPGIVWVDADACRPDRAVHRRLAARRLPVSGARLRRSREALSPAGLPEGTLAYATGIALAVGALAGLLCGGIVTVDEVAVAVEIRLPDVMAASYGASNPLRPAPPIPARGGGFYHADLGAPGAPEDFERMLGTLAGDVSARELAAQAQLWRLAVCDYRTRKHPPEPARTPVRFEAAPAAATPGALASPGPFPRSGPRLDCLVVDLTSMWAGPLATRLLGDLGATVTKVEPAFRLDGTRAVAGGGIYPGGVQVDPGRDSAMWNALNRWKLHEDLDLRDAAAVDRFVALAGSADVVIDSFSPRVLSNLDIPGRVGAGLLWVSMPAFGPGDQRDWVAYGTGVHAQSGLGDTQSASAGAERFHEPAVSYPDPLGGLTGALAVLAGLAARRMGRPVTRVEVSLDEAVQPLRSGVNGLASTGRGASPVPLSDISTLRCRCDREGRKLLELASGLGLTATWDVGGRALRHPSGLLRF